VMDRRMSRLKNLELIYRVSSDHSSISGKR
jgi:hypothetical protein